jgi:transcriptional regulator with XRE-family HTH domain
MNQSKLKKLRIQRYLTQDEIYVKSRRKIQPSRLSKLERGILLMTDRDKKILARIYGVSEEDLSA